VEDVFHGVLHEVQREKGLNFQPLFISEEKFSVAQRGRPKSPKVIVDKKDDTLLICLLNYKMINKLKTENINVCTFYALGIQTLNQPIRAWNIQKVHFAMLQNIKWNVLV
jgi:hypothetical protein